jgi:hypothetical protein
MNSALLNYFVKAMISWSPLSGHLSSEATEDTIARYEDIANDVVEVISDKDEKSIFKDDPYLVKEGLQLLAIAAKESNFLLWVDNGNCNNPIWRLSNKNVIKHGDCDSGHAFSMFQIHTGKGLWIFDNEFFIEREDGYAGMDLIRDRQAAIRTALHMIRYSFRYGKSLCAYTGEYPGYCPKGDARIQLAKDYFIKNPFMVNNEKSS